MKAFERQKHAVIGWRRSLVLLIGVIVTPAKPGPKVQKESQGLCIFAYFSESLVRGTSGPVMQSVRWLVEDIVVAFRTDVNKMWPSDSMKESQMKARNLGF
jgi:hypothetical protein